MLCLQPVTPRPAAGDIFVWICGLVAIVFCALAIELATMPLKIPPMLFETALTNHQNLYLPNKERALAIGFIAVAIMAVWVFILRDRWMHYEQSLDLLGVVPTRRTTISGHSGKVRPFSNSSFPFRPNTSQLRLPSFKRGYILTGVRSSASGGRRKPAARFETATCVTTCWRCATRSRATCRR